MRLPRLTVHAALIILALLLGMSASAQVTTVRMLTRGSSAAHHEALAEIFNQQSPDVKVVVERVAGGTPPYLERIILDVASGEPPDLMMVDEGIEISMLNRELLLNIAPYIARDRFDIDGYFPGLREFHVRNGETYSISLGSQLIVLLVNKDRLNRAGIPLPSRNWNATWTWDEVRQYGKLLVNPNTNPPQMAIRIDQSTDMWLPFLWQYGAEVFRSVNGRLVSGFDRPEARQAFELLHSLYHIDAIATVQGGVETGVSAMSMEGTWVLGSDFQLDFEWGVYPLPRGPAGAATQSSSNGIAILRDSKNPEAAWKFLKWLGGEGMPHVLATEKFGVPPNVGFAAAHIDQMFGAVPSDADRLTIFEGLQYSRSKPVQFYGTILDTARNHLLPSMVRNETALGPAIEQMVEQINRILSGE